MNPLPEKRFEMHSIAQGRSLVFSSLIIGLLILLFTLGFFSWSEAVAAAGAYNASEGGADLKDGVALEDVAAEPGLEKRLEKLEAQLEKSRVSLHIPGMAMAVVKDDALIWARGFGVADMERGTPVTPETLFAIGSSTKAFTATLIGMLVDEGKMSWDDPITRFLPELTLRIDAEDDTAEVTVRDLLCHRTGFTRMSMLFAGGGASRDAILRTAVKAKPFSGFRERFHYNNVMYLAAGQAMGRAADSDWDALMRDRIFLPLNMDNTNTSVPDLIGHEKLSLGYQWEEEGATLRRLDMRVLKNIAPAGAVNSNVLDMANWIRFLLNRGSFDGRRLISETQLEETWAQQIEMGAGRGYGLGWMLAEWNGQPVIEHGGNIDGFGAQVGLLPESNLGFVLLTNVTSTPLQQMSLNMVWEAILGEWVDDRDAEGSIDYAPYVGDYIANFGPFIDADFALIEKDGHLALDVPGQTVYDLKDPDEEGKWKFAVSDQIAVSFVRDEQGRIIAMKQHQGPYTFELPRKGIELPPEVPLDELDRYLGAYYGEELDETLTLEIKGNAMALNIPGQKVYRLRAPDEEGRWFFRVVDFIHLTFEESVEGQIIAMIFNERGKELRYTPVESEARKPLPSVEEIFSIMKMDDRRPRLNAMGAYRISGEASLEQSGLEGRFTWHVNGPDRYRFDLDFNEFGSSRISLFADMAWQEAPHGLILEMKGKFLDFAKHSHPETIFGDWRHFFDTFIVLRLEEDGDVRTAVIKAKGGDAPDVIAYVDMDTGDLRKIESMILVPGSIMSLPLTYEYDDYREVHGVRIPHRIVNSNDATGRTIMRVDEVEKGLKMEDIFFFLDFPSDQPTRPLTEERKALYLESFDEAWSLINERFWDPEFNGVDWEGVRDELRPRLERARTVEHAHMILNDMVLRLGVSHFGIDAGDFSGSRSRESEDDPELGVTGIDLRAIDGQAIVISVTAGSPAEKAGILRGWEIVEIDGMDIRAKLAKADAHLEENSRKYLLMTYSVVPFLTGKVGDSVDLKLHDGNDALQEVTLELVPMRGEVNDFGLLSRVDVWIETRVLDDRVGCITFNRFFDPIRVMKVFNESMVEFKDLDGIIIDVRGNPGGLPEMAKGMIGWFVKERNLHVGTMYSRNANIRHVVQPRPGGFEGPLAVLVDGLSGSTSEFFSSALQDLGRARIFGSRTKGELVNASFKQLPNGDLLFYADSKYVSSSGRCIEGEGVIPDEVVHHSRAALLEGKDAAIEAAMKWIDHQNQ